METTQTVIEGSDYLYKKECNWITDIPYEPPNEFELKLLEGTVSPSILLEKEVEEEIVMRTPEQQRRDVINKIKIVSLHEMGEDALCDPSHFRREKKKQLINVMQKYLDIYNEDKDQLNKLFNEACTDSIFDKVDYTKYPIYK